VDASEALEVFEHPYAYAAYRGLTVLDAAAYRARIAGVVAGEAA
jgi:hypothetical protein